MDTPQTQTSNGGSGGRFESAKTAAEFLSVWLNSRLLSSSSQKLVDDYYRNFRGLGSSRMRHWYNQQVADVDTFVRAKPGLRLLEIGVGTGTECLWLALRGADVTGIDAFAHCVATAEERLSVLRREVGRPLRCRLHHVPLMAFEDREGFDLIWLEQTFHHLEPQPAVVARIAALLRPGGRVVLSEANALNPLLQLQLLRARGIKLQLEVATEHGPMIYGNERVVSLGSLTRWLRRAGIARESVRYYRVFPAHPWFDSFFAVERRLSSRWLAPIYTHYNFVGRKVA